MRRCRALCLLVFALVPLAGQTPIVDARNRHERLLCVVPLIGAGTYADPKRPLFAPAHLGETPSGLLSYRWEPTDDGRRAIVEFVARDRGAFAEILASVLPDVLRFERQRLGDGEMPTTARQRLVVELRRLKRDFDPDKFATVLP